MTHATTDTAQQQYQTPTFDPRSAFAWTLRSGEVARRRQSGTPDRDAAPHTSLRGTAHKPTGSRPPRFETPTFAPRSAFAWTLRSGEVARRAHQQRRSDSPSPTALVGCRQ
jgi:hypothetical protein